MLKSPHGEWLGKPTCPNVGKADDWREETGKRTARPAGVEDQASGEGFAEITSGRSCGPAVGGPNCQDPQNEPTRRSEWEAAGLAHEAVVAVKGR